MVLGGGTNSRLYALNGGSWVNGADHTLRGSGYIEGPLTNEGLIIADNGTLNVSGAISNHTVMTAAGAGNVLALNTGNFIGGALNPQDGRVDLKGGAVLKDTTFKSGSYSVYNGNNLLAGGNTLTAGAQVTVQYGGTLNIAQRNNVIESGAVLEIANRGILSFQKDGELNPILTNNGTIKINSGDMNWNVPEYNDFAYMRADGCTVSLAGHGSVILQEAITGP